MTTLTAPAPRRNVYTLCNIAGMVATRRRRVEQFDVSVEFDGKPQSLPGCYLNCQHVLTVEVDRDDRDTAEVVTSQIEGVSVWSEAGVHRTGRDAVEFIGDRLPALLDELMHRDEQLTIDRALGF